MDQSSLELNANDESIIKGALRFTIHDSKGDLESSQPNAEGTLVVRYYDKNRNLIAIEDITALNLSKKSSAITYAKQRLDPDAKPKAYKAIINCHPKNDNRVFFYEQDETDIADFFYNGPASIEGLMEFNAYVDVSNLQIIEEHIISDDEVASKHEEHSKSEKDYDCVIS